MGRRDKDDEQWQLVKKRVDIRDRKQCRGKKCLSMSEAVIVEKDTYFESRLDHAHMYPASKFLHLIYTDSNILCLSRTFHRRFDNYQNLVTGDTESLNHHYWWMYRLLTKGINKYEESVSYEELCRNIVK